MRRRTQRERRELSYRRMMDAAFKLIARQGSSRTSLAEIGEASGYSHGLVSHRFGSKGALVRELTRHLQADFAKRVMPALEGVSGLAAILVIAETYLRAAASSPRNPLYVLIGEALGPVREIRPEMAEADRNFRLAIQARIAQGIRAGEIRRDADPAAHAAIVVGTLRGLVIQRMIDRDAFDLDAACHELKASIRRSLRRRSSTAARAISSGNL